MKQEIINGMVKITADEGYFLTNEQETVYGVSILLGKHDSPENYKEYPLSEYPVVEPQVEPLTLEEMKLLEQLLERQKMTAKHE